jgi:hypothetical protein
MSSKFETHRESEPTSEEFRNAIREKIEKAVNSLVGKKMEEYFQAHVNTEELERAANRIFSLMTLEGKKDQEILTERQKILDDITSHSL